MKRRFHWEVWSREHIAKHSVSVREAEEVVSRAKRPYPRKSRDGKFVVWGVTTSGRSLQVIFVFKTAGELDYRKMTLEEISEIEHSSSMLVCIIHARDLTDREKSQYRRFQ